MSDVERRKAKFQRHIESSSELSRKSPSSDSDDEEDKATNTRPPSSPAKNVATEIESKQSPTVVAKKRKREAKKTEKDPNFVEFDFDSVDDNDVLIAVPRSQNRQHSDKRIPFNSTNLYNMKLNMSVAKKFQTVHGVQQKFEFILNIVLTWRSMGYRWVKYDEVEEKYFEPSTSVLCKLIRSRLDRIATSERSKLRNQTKRVFKSPFDEFTHKCSLGNLYKKDQLLEEERIKDWNSYSILHSLFSSFSFYIYAYSHRVKASTSCLIHRATKLKLKFPPYPNMFVIFHGRAVHSGAESKMASICSLVPSHDERLFSYVRVKDKDKNWASLRTNNKGKDATDKVERNGLQMCTALTVCQNCSSFGDYDCFEIDLEECYNIQKERRRNTIKNVPLIGDLTKFGFEVWVGESTRSEKHIELKGELLYLLDREKEWKGLDNNTDRKVFKVARGEHDRNNRSQIFEGFVDSVENFVQTKIFKDRDCKLGRSSIIANRGYCIEQLCHRDFPNDNE